MLSCTTSAVCLLGSPLLSADLQPAGVRKHTHRDTETQSGTATETAAACGASVVSHRLPLGSNADAASFATLSSWQESWARKASVSLQKKSTEFSLQEEFGCLCPSFSCQQRRASAIT